MTYSTHTDPNHPDHDEDPYRGDPAAARRPRARLANDPDKYIRVTKNNKFQARPYDEGERFDLGCFPTVCAARKAIQEFWWGKRAELPRYTKKIHTKRGERYIAMTPRRPGERLGIFTTREAAARAVVKYVRREWGVLAERILSRRVKSRGRVDRPR